MLKEGRRHNSTYPKVAVQWLNQALCFYQSLCLADSESLRNRHLRVAAKRCGAFEHNYTENYSSQKQRNYEKNIDTFINRIFNFKLLE